MNENIQREFAQEVYILSKVCHKNVVKFIGSCTKPPNLCIVTDLSSMSRKTKRVCFSGDGDEKSSIFGGGGKSSRVSFLLRLGEKMVARAMRVVSKRRRSSGKVSSSSSTLIRSRSISDPTSDSHRAEAVEDCIEFLHSSSSRERPS
ncbi:Serine/threonine-protein kinase STY46 [Senna tora]|uniref:Serine/threonine-protein kinase STY46 n=1 Tax=Senna tora TaxID=362788 RepID=A0A834WNA3_9FABA|nr:Serine/threonine-protein kinase STY46 [Senna tora]